MYSLTRRLSLKRLLREEIPLAGASLIIAEAFFKFHSFTLECLAFLATWYALDVLVDRLRSLGKTRTVALLNREPGASRESGNLSESMFSTIGSDTRG